MCPRLDSDGEETIACAPLTVAGRAVGSAQIAAENIEPRDLETLNTIAVAVGARLGVVRAISERETHAQTDVLTGLLNRRAMNEVLSRLDRTGTPYAVIAAGLDHFKELNDTYGHEVGDRCLCLFAQVLRDSCRSGDHPCRHGGEEFAIVLPGASADVAVTLAERIREAVHDESRKGGIGFSCSFGIADRPTHGDSAGDVMAAADRALYAAKEAGRDRVVKAEDTAVWQRTERREGGAPAQHAARGVELQVAVS